MPISGSRRKGREAALQVLYQFELGGGELAALLDSYWSTRRDPGEGVRCFTEKLVSEVFQHGGRIDSLINESLENWDMSRLSKVDLNLLRLAVAELLCSPEVPGAVVIDEAVEVARRFSDPEAASFVNGVLDGIGRRLGRLKPAV